MQASSIVIATSLATLTLGAPTRAQAVLYSHHGAHASAQFGACVALLPDMNGDGVSDYAVGSPFEDYHANGTRRGVVRLYSGKTDELLRTYVGPGNQSEFGHSIAATPDITGDGLRDLLVGAPSHTGSLHKQGAAFLINSATGVQLGAYLGESANEFLGHAVANLGDVDGDGRDDWAVTAPFADVGGNVNSGRVRIYSGVNGSLVQDWNPQSAGLQAGWTIAGVGDVTGDGRADFVVGMPGFTDTTYNRTACGAAYLVRGMGAALWWSRGWENYEQFGWSVAALGDVDGDGRGDVAIGTPHFDGDGQSRGLVRVLSGANGAELFELRGSFDGYKLGTAISAIGDWNGDGVRDLAVSVPGVNLVGFGLRGQVNVHSGANGGLLSTFWGHENSSDWGRSIAGGRDLNGDGRSELLIGAPAEDANGVNAGRVRLLLGGVSAPSRYGSAKPNSDGCTPRIDSVGAPSRTLGDNFHITASNLVPDKAGMLFWGFTQTSTPFGGGTMLVGQPVVRTALQNTGGAAACSGTFDLHFSQALMQQHSLSAGQRLYAQYWHRDPGFAFPNNIGLTNALRFDIAH